MKVQSAGTRPASFSRESTRLPCPSTDRRSSPVRCCCSPPSRASSSAPSRARSQPGQRGASLAEELDERRLPQGDWPALAQLMQKIHDQGHDVVAITRVVTSAPLSDLPAQDLRYRLVAHLDLGVDLGRPPLDSSSAKITTPAGSHRKAPVYSVAPTRTPPR